MMPSDAPRPLVRRAGIADVDVAAPLFDAYREFYGAPSDIAAARTFLAERLERDESVVLLAFAGARHEALGFAQLYRSFSSVSLGAIVVLNDLFVSPNGRRLGIARRLVETAASHAASTGAIRLQLSTQHTNTSARALYDSMGFVADTEFAHLSLTL